MDDPSSKPVSPPSEKVVHELSYAGPTTGPGRTVTVGRYANSMEAAMHVSRLESEGITCITANSNVSNLGIPYSGFTTVDVQVDSVDAARALEILQTNPDELEPAEGSDVPAALDENGQPLTLVEAGRYESVQQLRSAETVLASSRVRTFAPILVNRGSRPRGTGRRFVLRVAEDDLERAQSLLKKAEADDADDDDPRCPECDPWRVYPVGAFWQSLGAMFGLARPPQKQIECLACRHRGTPEEFGM